MLKLHYGLVKLFMAQVPCFIDLLSLALL